MIKLLRLETFKLRRRKMWLVPLLFLLVIGFWMMTGTMQYKARGHAIPWEYLMYQFGMINALLLSLMVAIIASRLCDMELKGETLRMLTPIASAKAVYACKFLYGSILLLLTVICEAAIMLGIGLLIGISGNIPLIHILGMYFGTFMVAVCTLALQQALSFLFQNQMVCFIVGICGSFLGFLALLFPPIIQQFSFWSYYADFSGVLMQYYPNTRTMDFWFLPFPWNRLLVILALMALFYLVGQKKFVRKEW